MLTSLAVGIDWGCLYTRVAICSNDNTIENCCSIPSQISYSAPSWEPVIGETNVMEDVKYFFYDIKRFIGRDFTDQHVQTHLKNYPFDIINVENTLLLEIFSNEITLLRRPEDVLADMLRCIRDEITTIYNVDEIEAVITVPPHFNNKQKSLILQSAHQAKITVMQLLNENEAAIIYYKNNYSFNKSNILICDFGGTSFTLTLIKNDGIVAFHTDINLGGHSIDENLFNHIQKTCNRAKPIKNSILNWIVRNMKEKLTTCPHVYEENIAIKLTQKTFEQINAEIFDKCIKSLEQFLQKLNTNKFRIKDVIFIGGSSKIPKFKDSVKAFFGKNVNYIDSNPDYTVAQGAAIKANILAYGKRNTLQILNKILRSIGMKGVSPLMEVLIEKNSIYPLTRQREFIIANSKQENIVLDLFEGNHELLEKNKKIASIKLKVYPKKPNCITINLKVDENGVLTFSGTTNISQDEKKIKLNLSSEKKFLGEINHFNKLKQDASLLINDFMSRTNQPDILKQCRWILKVLQKTRFEKNDKLLPNFEIFFSKLREIEVNQNVENLIDHLMLILNNY